MGAAPVAEPALGARAVFSDPPLRSAEFAASSHGGGKLSRRRRGPASAENRARDGLLHHRQAELSSARNDEGLSDAAGSIPGRDREGAGRCLYRPGKGLEGSGESLSRMAEVFGPPGGRAVHQGEPSRLPGPVKMSILEKGRS